MTNLHRSRRPGPPGRERRGLSHWSPLLLTFLIGVLAVATPTDFAVSRLLPAAPALAASMWSVEATLLLGVLSMAGVLAIQFAYAEPGTTFTAASLAAVTAAAAYAAHVRLQRERTLVKVRSVADAAQTVVLRPVPHRLGGVGIETLYLAAAEEARIGGDFFEAVDTPHGVRVLLGDVRGKGLSAVGVASALTNSFREAAYDEPDLTRLARRLDTTMARYSAALTAPDAGERFATAVFAEVRRGGREVALLNCGHPPPLVLGANGAGGSGSSGGALAGGGGTRVLDPSAPSPPLNMARLIGGDYTVDNVALAPGDRLLFYTDGVIETRDRAGRFFPLSAWVARQTGVPAAQLLPLLHEQLLHFSGGALDDDIAALVVHSDLASDPRANGPSGASESP
ncbi:Serine phosphatase RsbU, regulator of sigma subunit [Actinacidiphila yanglinensis]|uniref:Serine phosphatase RsbU, regulator of sigma subunit n=1 Tax=Actinacidiphila yanglinensis TaxID=310779 RepID=A0A1H6E4G7_9ACTN|nr:PP2C family protein-serine/threonine phosphatase [Actinacidiphila yanglinensis]SEG91785.1 Serine phosphatase RsbU, regulator of sigma subunit [Actinacidiphila yanglinensis]